MVELKYQQTLGKAFKQIIDQRYVERALGYVEKRSGIVVDDCRIYVVAGNMNQNNQMQFIAKRFLDIFPTGHSYG